MDQDALKKMAANAALAYIECDMVIGVGSGSTVNYFIDALKSIKGKINGAVASSIETATRLKASSIPVIDLNHVNEVALYVDGADEINTAKQMIKGGGGALTREKIVASCAKKFICIVDHRKEVELLGAFPVAVEVIPMARSFVARELVKLGADPEYRQGFVTDNGNVIIDAYFLKILDPLKLEQAINNIAGVVANGIFAARRADVVLLAEPAGIKTL